MGHAGEYSEPAGSNCKFRVATIRLKPSCTSGHTESAVLAVR
jgi:hypothetical protein